MALKHISKEFVGVIGAGKFGTTIANLLAQNTKVLLYARRPESIEAMRATRTAAGQSLASNVQVVTQLAEITQRCQVLFPVVPSSAFLALMQQLAPLLQPDHWLIHCTKGLVADWPAGSSGVLSTALTRAEVKTMSEVISAISSVQQIGCLAGPNLADEIAQGQPAATVIASSSADVVEAGKALLQDSCFQVYGSSDLVGTELCGALKNMVAIGAGCLRGLGYGENAKAHLVTCGLAEMMEIGRAMGIPAQSFLGLAGIGDLVATCASGLSRNYMVGYQLAQGTSSSQVVSNSEATAEGINTTRIMKSLSQHYAMKVPITEGVYRILFEQADVQEVMQTLLTQSVARWAVA
ncbi:MAG: NAD(P)H-dependent glycerol-3-phosphate dehydrogenase [Bacteroidota bacterium]